LAAGSVLRFAGGTGEGAESLGKFPEFIPMGGCRGFPDGGVFGGFWGRVKGGV
jgi:hypothetical protein